MHNSSIESLSLYPCPDRVRKSYLLLSGKWKLKYDIKNNGEKEKWFDGFSSDLEINVPFCIESDASGIACKNPPEILWYAKEFTFPKSTQNKKLLLHFGAVDYFAKVWLNSKYLGEHYGGYTPFYFEVEKHIKEKNLLVVKVKDTKSFLQPRGKQTFLNKPFSIFYPTATGIWQDVWLEEVGEIYLERYELLSDIEAKEINFKFFVSGKNDICNLFLEIISPGNKIIKINENFKKTKDKDEVEIKVKLNEIYLWSPCNPNLYKLNIKIESNTSCDEVESYFGIRKIETKGNKIYLNNEVLYQKLLLVQGYFENGHYTPQNWDDFKKDVQLIKEMGFNGLRMHQKVENKKFLFWCDYIGCLVWEEMPSCYIFSRKSKEAIEKEWDDIIARDFNHPSIIVMVPFNESWGVGVFLIPMLLFPSAKNFVKKMYYKTKEKCPHRLVIDNSGYDHIKTDIVDIHHYLEDIEKCNDFYKKCKNPANLQFNIFNLIKSTNPGISPHPVFAPGGKYEGQPIIISEYGGFGFYKTKGKKTLLENFKEYTKLIMEQEYICGFCYTQFYDTYQEKNGLLSFNRTPKVEIEKIRKIVEG